MRQIDLLTQSEADFSACGTWRYTLRRRWADGPMMCWLMLNPSTADEIDNDPTVERCLRRAITAGFGAMSVANIFALRSTDPMGLYTHPDPVGPDNDTAIIELTTEADLVVCGWGIHGVLNRRGDTVRQMLDRAGVEPRCLLLTDNGQPGHPLYVSYAAKPIPIPET